MNEADQSIGATFPRRSLPSKKKALSQRGAAIKGSASLQRLRDITRAKGGPYVAYEGKALARQSERLRIDLYACVWSLSYQAVLTLPLCREAATCAFARGRGTHAPSCSQNDASHLLGFGSGQSLHKVILLALRGPRQMYPLCRRHQRPQRIVNAPAERHGGRFLVRPSPPTLHVRMQTASP